MEFTRADAIIGAMPIFASTAAMFQRDAQQRALLACVAISVALHAFILVSFPGLRPSSTTGDSKVLTARFAPRSADPESAGPITEPASTRAELPRWKEPPPLLASPTAVPVPQETETVPVAEPSASAATVAQSVDAEAARVADTPVQATQGGLTSNTTSDPSDDAATRRQYLIALVNAAKLYMRYPPQARERGWEGRVEVRLVIDANGSIKSAIVKRSSRYQILDDQALDMVKRGQPRLQIPPSLRGREFSVDIPVTFELLTG